MLSELLDHHSPLLALPADQIQLGQRFGSGYKRLNHLAHGPEISNLYTTLDTFLRLQTIDELAAIPPQLAWLATLDPDLLRPTAIQALAGFGDVGREVFSFQQATATSQQAAALNRAAGALQELASYLVGAVPQPEQWLLSKVAESWQDIVAKAQGQLGQTALRGQAPALRRQSGVAERQATIWQRPAVPFNNPYIAGDPVYPPLFVGRTDIFNRIGEIWTAKKNPDSIILYGHRRMGKSSILRNLEQAAPAGSLIVYADTAGETSFVESTADFLLALADKLHEAGRRFRPGSPLPEPDPALFSSPAQAQIQFNRFTGRVRDLLENHTLFLVLDEFEAIEKAVEAGKIGREIFQFLRTLTQEPWLTLVFGGLHTLDEMSHDYQQPFYGSYVNLNVSYLSPRDGRWLITNPTDDFSLNYEPAAVDHILQQSGGQPYLVQQICRDSLDYLNHQLFDLGIERESRILLADVQAVLADEGFFRRGIVYFDGVWQQASEPGQQAVLGLLAGRHPTALSLADIASQCHLSQETALAYLRWAERQDILFRQGDQWFFYVPLMRQWIGRRGRL